MIAITTTRRQQATPAPRRDPVAFLLLAGIERTNARPWIGFVGIAACWLLCVILENFL